MDNPAHSVTDGMRELIDRLLCKDPSRRYRSALELLEHIESMTGTQGSARPLPLDLLGERIEEIEGLARDSIAALESSQASLDSALLPLSRLSRRSVDFLERIDDLSDEELKDPIVAALLSSVQAVGRSVDERLRLKVEAQIEGAEGPLHQLRTQLLDRATSLLSRTRTEASGEQVSDFFSFDATPDTAWESHDVDWQAALLSHDELERHEGMLAILGSSRNSFLRTLSTLRSEDRTRLLHSLWAQADLLLLEGRMGAKEIFEAIVAHCDEQELQSRWVMLFSMFRSCSKEPDLETISMVLSTLPGQDRRVIGRSLLIHPQSSLRTLAFDLVEPRDLWPIVHPSTDTHFVDREDLVPPRIGDDRRFQEDLLRMYPTASYGRTAGPRHSSGGKAPGALFLAEPLSGERFL